MDADIVCLQEFYPDEEDKINLKSLSRNNTNEASYLAIYSKYQHVIDTNKGQIYMDDNKNINKYCIYSDLLIKEDTIRVYNIHLASNWFNNSDYTFMKNPQQEIRKGVLGIIKRMKNSYVKRAEQAEMIREHINTSPHPIIICGDFNDTPLSYAYNHIKGNLTDAFNISGKGVGKSFIKIPALRIDYILHNKDIKSSNYTRHNKQLSDHYPISCEITIQ